MFLFIVLGATCISFPKRFFKNINWASNNVISVSQDGISLAFISVRNNTSNIFLKDLEQRSASIKRTNRNMVQDLSYSYDGTTICFSEISGDNSNIYITDAVSGFVCRQITSASNDYGPAYSKDGTKIFFSRSEAKSSSIWSYDITNKFLSSYSQGINPEPTEEDNSIYCVKANARGAGEIYKVNYIEGIEECIVSDKERSFSNPHLSPNGQWLVFAGSSKLQNGKLSYWNVDIYACRIDGSELTQLTYHAADDLSPIWDITGKYIYFVSQRGSEKGTANIWRMNFNLLNQ